MKAKKDFIDQNFEFKGLWDIPSLCGLKITVKNEKTIVIVSELHKENTGTSVTKWCAQLANLICEQNKINTGKLVYIEHTPEMNSKLSFYEETFNIVQFDFIDNKFANPKWQAISKEDVIGMIS